MKFFDRLCETVISALGLSNVLQWDRPDQHPMPGAVIHSSLEVDTPTAQDGVLVDIPAPQETGRIDTPAAQDAGLIYYLDTPPKTRSPDVGPIFKPPDAQDGFVCDYSAMTGWQHTGGVGARTQWLSHPIDDKHPTGGVYDIFTNYDLYTPIGKTRKYTLIADEHPINADGYHRRAGGKAFNGTYPGPLIEACWGDTIEITIINHLDYNGTAIHWHGVRMLNAFEYDGVNAISQCPIAPNDYFTYKFKITQYGTSWYHSHYSAQYPDGLAGPMTFHGPSSADFDEAMDPFMFSDWSHNSAFEDFSQEIHGGQPSMQSNVLNGAGYFNCTKANLTEPDCGLSPPIFTKVFQRGRRYLLKLINASTEATFIFSIDKHILQVVGADFVPIKPYYTESILVGIGQRYHVVVEARPSDDLIPVEDQNYWIRNEVAHNCGRIDQPNPLIGIIRYNSGSSKTPTTKKYIYDTTCADEPLASLVPVVPWKVSAGPTPANDISENGANWAVGLEIPSATNTVPHGNLTRWNILDNSMWLNFSNPTINNLHDPSFNPDDYCLVTENYTKDDWVYMIITMNSSTVHKALKTKTHVEAAHPIHLHGHDFVILAQLNRTYDPQDVYNVFNYDNPPRRDVALLPSNGYLAIGFRTDNPGLWIMHCHIAWHASAGLALQIREREPEIKLSSAFIQEKNRVCKGWNHWYANKTNWWNPEEFQEDSGV